MNRRERTSPFTRWRIKERRRSARRVKGAGVLGLRKNQDLVQAQRSSLSRPRLAPPSETTRVNLGKGAGPAGGKKPLEGRGRASSTRSRARRAAARGGRHRHPLVMGNEKKPVDRPACRKGIGWILKTEGKEPGSR